MLRLAMLVMSKFESTIREWETECPAIDVVTMPMETILQIIVRNWYVLDSGEPVTLNSTENRKFVVYVDDDDQLMYTNDYSKPPKLLFPLHLVEKFRKPEPLTV